MTRLQIINQARYWMDVPYLHHGRSSQGLDCVGLVECVAKELGVIFNDRTDYNKFGFGLFQLNQELARWLKPVYLQAFKPGDVLTFSGRDKLKVCHCGIATDRGLLHCHGMLRKVTEHGWTDFWKERIAGAFSFPGVED